MHNLIGGELNKLFCLIFQKADSEEKDRNLDILVEPSIVHSRRGTHRALKFLAVSGSVALLSNDPAFAASLIANGTQSLVTSLGDLGDISSGFASVRESSFCTEPGTICLFWCYSFKFYVLLCLCLSAGVLAYLFL